MESGAQLLLIHRPQGFLTICLKVPVKIEADGVMANGDRLYTSVVAAARGVYNSYIDHASIQP
jgi:hypothetical protein